MADQLSIRLVIAFSEAGQPLTLTSDPNDADQDETPDIFCAIATTTCDQFLTVRTQSDQPQSNGRTGSGSSTSFLNRNNSRHRDLSVGVNGSGEGGEGERNVRPRYSSEQPGRRGKLPLSTQPSRVPNSVPTTTSRTSNGPSASQQHQHRDGEDPLFIPTDTQYGLEDDFGDQGQENSQAPPLSQAQIDAIAGLGDMDDVMDGMDDLQHDEEVEELRASQQVASQAPVSSNRQPLAERPLDGVEAPDPDPLSTEAHVEENGRNAQHEQEELEHEGDVTHQADFVVHEHQEVDMAGNEVVDAIAEPVIVDVDAHEAVVEGDTTAAPPEGEEEEDITFPATQADQSTRSVSQEFRGFELQLISSLWVSSRISWTTNGQDPNVRWDWHNEHQGQDRGGCIMIRTPMYRRQWT